ncbi:MAG: YfbU family protein [Oscillospiraceae bacterium]|nr:YfbU family protein [Oscillospiraceae bacterium]
MKLTQVERQILYNQYKILSILCPDNKNCYEEKMNILHNGYTSCYGSDIVNVDGDEIDETECRFVEDVLFMYRSLYDSYKKLADKSGISEEAVKFDGFDCNNEGKHYSFAAFLTKERDEWSEFKTCNTNSHAHRVELYEQMLAVYKSLPKSQYLSKEDIIAIINCSNRKITVNYQSKV